MHEGHEGRRPRGLPVAAIAAGAFLALPILGLLQRTPWSELWAELTSPTARTALRLSLLTSAVAATFSLALGVPLAWLLARTEGPAARILRLLTALPLVLPPVVSGVALLLALGRRGLVGAWLHGALGITLPFTVAGAVVAQTFVAMPFLVLSVEAGFRAVDPRLEDAAATLGARPWHVLRRVTLPLAGPSIVAGLATAWARALGEFGATITFAGNLPGETQTLPLAVFLALEADPEAAISMSLLLLAVSAAVLIGLRARWLPAR